MSSDSDRLDDRKRLEQLHLAYNDRVKTLFDEYGTFNHDDIGRVRQAARRLRTAKNLSALFQLYEALDKLEVVERALEEAAAGWQRHLEQEFERSRGN